MLTGFQVATGAYETEDGELLSETTFDQGEHYARPVSNYELDERQTQEARDWLDWEHLDTEVVEDGIEYRQGLDGMWHIEDCGCEPDLIDIYGVTIRDSYEDSSCRSDQPDDDDEPDW
jgi:hypothetical protein